MGIFLHVDPATNQDIIFQVIRVFAYFSEPEINHNFGSFTTDILSELDYFSERYNAVHNTNIDLDAFHREFMANVVIQRMERVQTWLQRRLQGLLSVWQQEVTINPANIQAPGVVLTLNTLLNDIDQNDLFTDRNGMPSPPPP